MRIQALLLFSASLALSFMAAQVPARAGDLTNPASLNAKAPATYKVKFDTSKGVFVVEVHRDWAPNGADRFYNLVKNGFYNDTRFFRVISGFMVQFGINGDPQAVAGLARRQHQGRPGQGQQQARQHHLRHRRPRHPHHPGVHQFRQQCRARRPGLRAVRPSDLRHGGGRFAL